MIEDNFYKKYGNLYLTKKQVEVLTKYNIDYNNFKTIDELIYHLEYYLNNDNLTDLEQVSEKLAEINYYNNTNK